MVPDTEVTFYTCASKQSHHEVVTEKSVSAVWSGIFILIDLNHVTEIGIRSSDQEIH